MLVSCNIFDHAADVMRWAKDGTGFPFDDRHGGSADLSKDLFPYSDGDIDIQPRKDRDLMISVFTKHACISGYPVKCKCHGKSTAIKKAAEPKDLIFCKTGVLREVPGECINRVGDDDEVAAKAGKHLCCFLHDRQVCIKEVGTSFDIRCSGSSGREYAEVSIPKTSWIGGDGDVHCMSDVKFLRGEHRLIYIMQNYFIGEIEGSGKKRHFSTNPSGAEACQ